jgi:hypothetical protein
MGNNREGAPYDGAFAIDPRLAEAKQELFERFLQPYRPAKHSSASRRARGFENITGVGIAQTLNLESRLEPCVVVFVNRRYPNSLLEPDFRIPSSIQEIPVRVVETGQILASSYPIPVQGAPPVPCGVPIAHKSGGTGTLGCVLSLDGADHYILSCDHVLGMIDTPAGIRRAQIGDEILQPGPDDGGIIPDHVIGELAACVPVRFGGPVNYVDCAVAKTTAAHVDPSRTCCDQVEGFSPGKAAIKLNLEVLKCGAITGATEGSIVAIGTAVRITYGSNEWAVLDNQFVVQGTINGAFARRGDSGSVVVTKKDRKPIGLLCAVAQATGDGIINVMDDVLDALNGAMHGHTAIIT